MKFPRLGREHLVTSALFGLVCAVVTGNGYGDYVLPVSAAFGAAAVIGTLAALYAQSSKLSSSTEAKRNSWNRVHNVGRDVAYYCAPPMVTSLIGIAVGRALRAGLLGL